MRKLNQNLRVQLTQNAVISIGPEAGEAGAFGALLAGRGRGVAPVGTSITNPSLDLRYSFFGKVGAQPEMIQLSKSDWEIAAGLASIAALGAAVIWLIVRRRPSEDELEQHRRQFLVQSGRLVDGMLLDICEMSATDGRTLTLLLFSYRIGGVDYECSQDITTMRTIVDPAQVRVGFPCSVRYQPGNPQNSIVVAEGWSGLRARLPQFHTLDAPAAINISGQRRKGTSD